MLTAIWTVHRANGLWVSDGGFKYNLVLLAVLFGLSAIGAGEWSLDEALALDMSGAGFALAELVAGLLGAIAAVTLGRSARRTTGGAEAPPARA
jgi:putative oxidoreductase